MKETGPRSLLRRFARQQNLIGFACSMILCLVREGPGETLYRIRLRLGRGYAERKYVRRLLHPKASDLRRQRETIFPDTVNFSIAVPLYNTPLAFLREMVESVQEQTFGRWELCLADGSDAAHGEVEAFCRERAKADPRIRYRKLERNEGISGNTNVCLDMATGNYIALFDHDDLLLPDALYEAAKVIAEQGADFVYSDEMVFASPNRSKAVGLHFKPDYAPDNLLANNYICHLTIFRTDLLERAGRFRPDYDGSQDHDLILRLTSEAERIVHIPKILYLWRSHPSSVAGDIASKTYAVDAGRRAVKDFLAGRGVEAEVESSPVYPTMYHVRYPIKGQPSVSLIADGDSDPERTGASLKRLTELAEENVCEALVTAEAGIKTADSVRLQMISSSGKTRAERLNEAAARAKGDYLLFLSGDLRTENRDWLREMLMLAQREDTGAVGSLILFEDGRVRHAGLILGFGKGHIAGRGHYRAEAGAGYFGQLAIVEDVSAVSGECLLIRRSLFERMHGFDPTFGQALWDVDLCLRLREEGLLVVYTPYPALTGGRREDYPDTYGMERQGYAAEAEAFRLRWRNQLEAGDMYYNPNLTLDLTDFRVRVSSGA